MSDGYLIIFTRTRLRSSVCFDTVDVKLRTGNFSGAYEHTRTQIPFLQNKAPTLTTSTHILIAPTSPHAHQTNKQVS